MGYIRHHAMVVTGFNKRHVNLARREAENRFTLGECSLVSSVITSPINGYYSFFIAPDGSKEGWEESKGFDRERGYFADWLREQAQSERFYSWAIVQYGDDDLETLIVDDSDAINRKRNEAEARLNAAQLAVTEAERALAEVSA